MEMADIGHFPMSENPTLFNAYLKEILADVTGERDEALPDTITPEDVGVEVEKVKAGAVSEEAD